MLLLSHSLFLFLIHGRDPTFAFGHELNVTASTVHNLGCHKSNLQKDTSSLQNEKIHTNYEKEYLEINYNT